VSAFIIGGKGPACRKDPRIEIVALKNHVFVLVGRTGGFLEVQGQGRGGARTAILRRTVLPPPTEWGASTMVVDGWAGSLGRPVIYKSWDEFGFRNEPGANALFSYYDNDLEQ